MYEDVKLEHPYYTKRRNRIETIRDVAKGSETIREKGCKYLFRIKGQDDEDYSTYLKNTEFFSATTRTLQAYEGLIFRKPPVTNIETETLDALYPKDTIFESLVKKVVNNVLQVNNHCVLIDYPVDNTEYKSQLEVEANQKNPILVDFDYEQIINFDYENDQLVLVVIKTTGLQRKNRFEHENVDTYIALELVNGIYTKTVYTFSSSSNGNSVIGSYVQGTPKVNGSPLNYIPFYTVNSLLDTEVSSIINPLVDLNLTFYRFTGYLNNGLPLVALPTPYLLGNGIVNMLPKNKNNVPYLPLGPTSAIIHDDPNINIGYLTYDGKGLEQVTTRLQTLRDAMAALGSRALTSEKKQVESAETARIHRTGEHSTLANVAVAVSNFISKLLEKVNEVYAITTEATVSYELNTDFIPEDVDGSMLGAIIKAWQDNAISQEDMFNYLQQAEILPRERVFKEYIKNIAAEKEAKMKLFAQQSLIMAKNGMLGASKEASNNNKETKEETDVSSISSKEG